MTIVSEIPWDAIANPDFGTKPAREVFRDAVRTVAERAKAALPDAQSRIDAAVTLVLASAVELLADGTARVASQDNGTTGYHIVNGHCDCTAFPQAPQGWCPHRLAHALCKRATALAQQTLAQRDVPVTVQPHQGKAPTIPAEFVTTIHGKEFVQFAGLLAMAHAQGLISLQAELLTVTPDLATARATATFADRIRYLPLCFTGKALWPLWRQTGASGSGRNVDLGTGDHRVAQSRHHCRGT